jgi:hypothetical protein
MAIHPRNQTLKVATGLCLQNDHAVRVKEEHPLASTKLTSIRTITFPDFASEPHNLFEFRVILKPACMLQIPRLIVPRRRLKTLSEDGYFFLDGRKTVRKKRNHLKLVLVVSRSHVRRLPVEERHDKRYPKIAPVIPYSLSYYRPASVSARTNFRQVPSLRSPIFLQGTWFPHSSLPMGRRFSAIS